MVDSFDLTEEELKSRVKSAVRYALKTRDAEENIKKSFSPKPYVRVRRGRDHFEVYIQFVPKGKKYTFICP